MSEKTGKRNIADELIPELEPYELKFDESKGVEYGGVKATKETDSKGESKSSLAYEGIKLGLLPNVEVDAGTTKETDTDKTFATFFRTKISDLSFFTLERTTSGDVKMALVEGGVDFAGYYAEVDLLDSFGLERKRQVEFGSSLTISFQPHAARVGDQTMHGTNLFPGIGSPNVTIGGKAAWRAYIDMHFCPFVNMLTLLPHGFGTALTGTPKVMINGMPAVRAGDTIIEIFGETNAVIEGCPTVSMGEPAPAILNTPPPLNIFALFASENEEPWIDFDLISHGRVGSVNISGLVGYKDSKEDGSRLGILFDGGAALLKGDVELSAKIRLPYSDQKLVLGGALEGSLLGAEGKAGAYYDDKKKKFTARAGGTLGVGAAASLSIGLE